MKKLSKILKENAPFYGHQKSKLYNPKPQNFGSTQVQNPHMTRFQRGHQENPMGNQGVQVPGNQARDAEGVQHLSNQQTQLKNQTLQNDPLVRKTSTEAQTAVNELAAEIEALRPLLGRQTKVDASKLAEMLPSLQQRLSHAISLVNSYVQSAMSSNAEGFPSPGQGQFGESVFHEHDYMINPGSESGKKERQIVQNLKAIQMYANETQAKIDAGDYRAAFDYLSELVNKSRSAMMSLKQYLQSQG